MANRRVSTFSTLAAVIALALPASAQSVISIRSGVIHFFEGAVYLGDQPLESHLGRFPSVPQGAELRTAEGRAEVLLTPGVFLRMGERTAIRMLANDLADTRVEVQTGSVIVDSGEPNPGTSVTLIYKDWRVRLLQKGVYRIDSDPPCLWVRQGQAEVLFGASAQPVTVGHGMSLPLAGVLVPEQSSEPSSDALNAWADGRSESISADNAITAQIDEDPASQTAGLDGFTYFPFLGLPSVGLASSYPYSSFPVYQPGFSSIYLPGYTYRPLMVGLMGRRFGIYPPSPPRRIGVITGSGPIIPIQHPPIQPPGPMHGTPHPGVHVGGHR
jgi:hypothetical protein